MFIVTAVLNDSPKLRRSGMESVFQRARSRFAASSTCRSYGAWISINRGRSINMALLRSFTPRR